MLLFQNQFADPLAATLPFKHWNVGVGMILKCGLDCLVCWQGFSVRGAESELDGYKQVEDGEVENLAPTVDNTQGTYTFGGPTAGQPNLPRGGFNFGTPMS